MDLVEHEEVRFVEERVVFVRGVDVDRLEIDRVRVRENDVYVAAKYVVFRQVNEFERDVVNALRLLRLDCETTLIRFHAEALSAGPALLEVFVVSRALEVLERRSQVPFSSLSLVSLGVSPS
ncbi:hypothetical protein ACFQL4_18330 [Halosimplex aquaticum]